MRRIIVFALAALLALSAAGYAEGNRVGVLKSETDAHLHYQHMMEFHTDLPDVDVPGGYEHIAFDSLTTLLLGLRSGAIDEANLPECTAKYVAQRNQDMQFEELPGLNQQTSYSMMVRSEDADLYAQLNQVFADMKEDGTLDALVEEQLTACIESDPLPVELPVFEDGPTLRVALTGDLPPMDLVSADGQPAGFNLALLSEIANRIRVNFEPVTVSSASRIQALASQRVDLVFWSSSAYCEEHDFTSYQPIEGTLLTDHYYLDKVCALLLKD